MDRPRERVSPEGLQLLPLRSIALLAARCAERVRPVFSAWNDACGDDKHAEAVEQAIQLALDFARGRRKAHEICGECDNVPRAADEAAKAASKVNAYHASNAAEAAACAATAAVNAADSTQGMTPHDRTLLRDAAAKVAHEAGQRMLLALEGEAKSTALSETEAYFAELPGDRSE